MAQVEPKSVGEKLQSVNRTTLYAILFFVTSVPLFFSGLKVPNKPEESTMDLYAALMDLPENSTVLLASDWTLSTRGESGGQFEALLRILMRKHIKAAIYTTADPQAPQVARDTIAELNKDNVAKGDKPYERWNDYIVLGYFPNAEGTAVSIGTNPRAAFGGRRDIPPGGVPTDVFESPVLKDVKSLTDFKLVVILTASNTSTVTIERLSGKVPLAMLVTGVMGPETQVYYSSGQLLGLSKGLKGVYDLETMMESGIRIHDKDYPPFTGKTNLGRGSIYYPTLHFALALLILAVVIGNVGMAMGKRRRA